MGIILLYHRIATSAADPWALNVSAENFAEHVDVIRASRHPCALQELVEDAATGRAADGDVAVTFDDGYANNLHVGVPILESAGVPATFFIPSGSIDCADEFWWDELDALLLSPGTLPARLHIEADGRPFEWTLGDAACYSDASSARDRGWVAWELAPTTRHALYRELWTTCRDLSGAARTAVLQQLRTWAGRAPAVRSSHRTLTRAELAQLARSPIAEIAGHTVTHPRLSSLPPSAQRVEIEANKKYLEGLTRRPLRAFSYPFGKDTDYSAETINLVREAGYALACRNVPGPVSRETAPLRLPRYFVTNLNRVEFAEWLSLAAASA